MTVTAPSTDAAARAAAQLEAALGLEAADVRYGLSQDELFAAAVALDRGRVRPGGGDDEPKAHPTALGADGPLVFYSDPSCTGRPVADTFCVDRASVTDAVWWKTGFARFEPERFDALAARVAEHLNRRRPRLYVADLYCGWDPSFAEPYRFVGEYATHAYFCNIMFPGALAGGAPASASVPAANGQYRPPAAPGPGGGHGERGWTLLNVPSYIPSEDPDPIWPSERAVIVDIERKLALVLGRADYCGVNKKTMFTIMNYVAPARGHLSMHCAANVGASGDSAVLFGLSGTGKTTLSAEPGRQLIGDDEHVWTDRGVFNFEAGCYAKLIDLDKRAEPVIAAALSMKGTLIENVPPRPGRDLAVTDPQELDLADGSVTENTRFAYPLGCNPNLAAGARGPHPSTVVLLTADAFGVLPPVSILGADEALYHFVMGFTARLAGTEVGVTEPAATFSSCFGAPFMAQRPHVYAGLLRSLIERHRSRCVLLNTGWTGGPYGRGERMSLAVTRKLLDTALAGGFDGADTVTHPILGLRMPTSCPGVDGAILNPRHTWDDPAAYDEAATRLRDLFRANYDQQGYASLGIDPVM